MIKVFAVRCPGCDDIVFSRARHDMRSCTCGETAVDGGFDYTKTSAKEPLKLKYYDVELNCTKADLYNDWNKREDKYGIITPTSAHSNRKNVRGISERRSKE